MNSNDSQVPDAPEFVDVGLLPACPFITGVDDTKPTRDCLFHLFSLEERWQVVVLSPSLRAFLMGAGTVWMNESMLTGSDLDPEPASRSVIRVLLNLELIAARHHLSVPHTPWVDIPRTCQCPKKSSFLPVTRGVYQRSFSSPSIGHL